jgi:ATP synthase subunit 6
MHSPLEQFRILSILEIIPGKWSIELTNSTLLLGLSFLFLFFILNSLNLSQGKATLVPTPWHSLILKLHSGVTGVVRDNIGAAHMQYYPFLLSLLLFVACANLVGLVPYSFTATSHLVVTLHLALIVFIGANIICLGIHGFHMLCLFLPSGTLFALSFLLVPIEIVSYFFKPISLGVRLFANMMAGHTLLKVIGGFAWSMLRGGGFLFFGHFVPLAVLFLLMGLELGVALIQSYVFLVLSSIYLRDSIALH